MYIFKKCFTNKDKGYDERLPALTPRCQTIMGLGMISTCWMLLLSCAKAAYWTSIPFWLNYAPVVFFILQPWVYARAVQWHSSDPFTQDLRQMFNYLRQFCSPTKGHVFILYLNWWCKAIRLEMEYSSSKTPMTHRFLFWSHQQGLLCLSQILHLQQTNTLCWGLQGLTGSFDCWYCVDSWFSFLIQLATKYQWE